MGSGIYKVVKGQRVEMSSREVKAYIMKQNQWTSDEYNKKYDIFKNKLRAYENYERAHGSTAKRQSPAQLLFKEAKAKATHGAEYTPSFKMKRIRSFTSVSSGKAGQKALEGKTYQARRTALYESTTSARFKGFMDAHKDDATMQKINQITDPVKREKALTAYANAINEKIAENEKEAKKQAEQGGIPASRESFGSSDAINDFDISEYI